MYASTYTWYNDIGYALAIHKYLLATSYDTKEEEKVELRHVAYSLDEFEFFGYIQPE